jgi:glycosyltransferase involved in cell wall biosynthesis
MRLVAASRVLNEDDILEAFVRHHAALVDHHIFLDNGSSDRSLAILRSLQAEGLSLTVLQTRAAHFCETPLLTALFRMAAGMDADWVVMLDCDEFVDERGKEGSLRATLAALRPEQGVLGLPVSAFHPMADDDAADLLVPRRIRWREREPHPEPKIVLRGALAGANVSVAPGSHGAMRDGQVMPMPLAGDLGLAHFPHRSPWQQAAKSAIGRLKVIAAGQEMAAGNLSNHYNADFDRIRNDPASLLRDAGLLSPGTPETGLVEDPIDYRGGELRHTVAGDPITQAIAGIAAFGEALATQHGRLLDTNEGARLQVHNWSLTWSRLT